MDRKKYDLIVVGGGASGLMAAGRAGERGLRVLLLEKNKRLGEKLRISGGGRCNITNAEEDERVLLKKYGKAEKFLYSLFAQFGIKDTFSFFESRGLPFIIEAGKRAFPQTEKAEDVVRVLEEYMRKGKVEIKTNSPVTKVEIKNGIINAVFCGKDRYEGKDYLLATGGLSHPETGSTGDGLKWLESFNHTVVESTPTVVPLAVKERWIKDLAGLTVSDVKIIFYLSGKKQFSLSGKILFTHFGLSGPLILNTAYKVAELLKNGPVTATIDIFSNEDINELEHKIIAIFDANKNKELKNILKEIVPDGMNKGMVTLLSKVMDLSTKVHSISRVDRKYLVQLLKALPVTIEGLMGFDRAVVADGGLKLEEIDWKTMRSKKIANLFVTGDILHVNRPSGGYSLQLCWSTGYVAGTHASKTL